MTDYSQDPDFQYLAVDRKKLMKEQLPFDGKKACWIPDDKEGFARAEIVSSKGEEITVKLLATQQVNHSKSFSFPHHEISIFNPLKFMKSLI